MLDNPTACTDTRRCAGMNFSGILEKYFVNAFSMFTLELNLKQTPAPLMIQKKSSEDAQADYQRLTEALKSGNTTVVELSCDQVPEKRVSVLVNEIAAVQIYEKTGTTSASGKPPGFFALMGDEQQ
ncbi:MAG: hypothetical protein AAGH78_06980 [Cyanobacteria bacterium P01_H01_bin.58]